MRAKTLGLAVACVACAFGQAAAQDIGIASRKLVIVDKLVAAGKAKTVYVAADPAITKGSGTDVGSISFGLSTSYQSALGPTTGTFAAHIGGFNGVAGWTANKDGVAKYVNKLPLDGPTDVKVAVIKPGTSLKMVGLSLGDSPIDLINTGVPLSDVCVLVSIVNATTLVRLCSRFQPPTVQFREIAQGTGRKLIARIGVADPSCAVCGSGPPVPTTTTTIIAVTTTSSSVTTSIPPPP